MDDAGDAGDAEFQARLARFEAADERFRVLSEALKAYRDAITAMANTGVAVAEALVCFFEESNSGGTGGSGLRVSRSKGVDDAAGSGSISMSVPAAFRAAQEAIQQNWLGGVAQRFDNDVYKGVRDSLDQFPQVRNYVKQRCTAQQEMLRRQKKLKDDAGARGRDKHRKWRECSDRFKMFDDEVMQRFSNIDRAQPGLVTKPLRLLVSLLDEFSRDSATAFHGVAALLTTTPPAITREFEPPPRHDPLVSGISTMMPTAAEDEGWDDDFDFRNSDALPKAATAPPEPSRDVKPAGGSGHNRTRSAAAVPSRLVVSDTGTRRAASGPPSGASRFVDASPEPASSSGRGHSVTWQAPKSMPKEQLTPSVLDAIASEGGGHAASANTAQSFGDGGRDAAWDQESRSEKEKVQMRLAATFDFAPTETNELPLRKGCIIEVYEQHASGWWLGRSNHVTGFFPRNHARSISEEEELEFINERARRRRDRRRGHRRKDSMTASQSSVAASATGANDGATRL
jgi:SH3 domain